MGDEQRQKLSDIFSFETFRRELLDFLRSQGLWFSAMEILPHWVKFVEQYAKVVADCPIIHTKNDLQLRWMDRAVLTAYQVDDETVRQIRAGSPYAECSFGLRWTFFKGEKQILKWEVPVVFEDYEKIHAPSAPPREDIDGDSTPSG